MSTQIGPNVPAYGLVTGGRPIETDAAPRVSRVEPVKTVSGTSADRLAQSPAEQKAREVLRQLQEGVLASNARLAIEEDETTGSFVYKTFDKITGELLNQWPREQILAMMAHMRENQEQIVDETV